MGRSNKEAWLSGPSDIREAEVDDVPVPGESVLVRGLPAAYSSQATSEAMELTTGPRGEQRAKVNTVTLERLQFHHGVIEPEFTLEEAGQIQERFGPAFKKVIDKIDELSGVDKEAITQAEARFPARGVGSGNGTGEPAPASGGDGGPAVPTRAGD